MMKNFCLPFTVLFLVLGSGLPLFGQNITEFTLEKSADRFHYQMVDPEALIQLCGLEEGEEYSIQVVAQLENDDRSYFIQLPGKEQKSARVVWKADGNCQSFFISRNTEELEGTKAPSFLWLSVDRRNKGKGQLSKILEGMEVAPIGIDPNYTAQQLVEDVFIGGGCFEVSNITQIGSDAGLGYFSNGMTSINLPDGVILASGNVLNAEGPNSSGSTGNSLGQPGDSDLQQLSGVASNDAHGIEFDFTPTLDAIQFRFAFASDEYCEYVNAGVNDAFGFFISGPGLNGPYSGGAENIALIPFTNTAVSINTVNHLQNTLFFRSNDQGTCNLPAVAPNDIEYDGMTTVLVATANVIPCETYHIKLVVGDGGDFIFDSAVFLQANSFEAGGDAGVELNNPITGTNTIYEGCGESFIVFSREDATDLTDPLEIIYTIDPASTATPGSDYTPIPSTIIIPPGQTEVIIPITAFEDGITEGPENIIIMVESPCNCSTGMAEIIINEAPPLDATMEDVQVCGPEVTLLSPTLDGGVPVFDYQWDDGSANSTLTVTPNQTTTYTVTVTDACGATAEASSTITVTELPTATISGFGVLCNNNPSVTVTVDFTGPGPWDLFYFINGALQPPVLGITQNPYTFEVSTPGVVTLNSVNSGICEGFVSGQAQIDITDIILSTFVGDVSCQGGDNGFIELIPIGGNQPLEFEWNNGDPSEDLVGIEAGDYTVTVTDAFGCTAETTTTVEDGPEFIAQLEVDQAITCFNADNGAIEAIVTQGGSGSYTYEWSNGGNTQTISDLEPGTYFATVTDLFNCEDTVSISISEPPEIITDVLSTDSVDCSSPSAGSVDLEASGGTGSLTYLWSNGSTDQDPSGLNAGIYTVEVSDSSNCVVTDTAEIIGDFDLPLVAVNVADILDCATPEVLLDGTGSSTGPNFVYEWTTSDGNISDGDSSLIATANATGQYTLTVYNLDNNCISSDSAEVSGDFSVPTAEAGLTQEISCNANALTLDGNGSAVGPNYSYLWTTAGGNIVSGETTLSPDVNAAGWYYIEVLDSLNGCIGIDSVEITQDENLPTVNAGTAETLTCDITETQLNGSASTNSGNTSFVWVTLDGNIVSGDSTLTPLVDAPGIYTLQVTDLDNGCSAVSSVTVPDDTAPPAISIDPPQILTCVSTEITVDASASDGGTGFEIGWNTQNGQITSGDSTLTPSVDAPGTYYISILNETNGCISIDSVEVNQDIALPDAEAGAGPTITCTSPTVGLDGAGSSTGSDFDYLWTSTDGTIDSGDSTLSPLVSAPGTYELLVTNEMNGCTAVDQVSVGEDIVPPDLMIADPATITCAFPIIMVNAGGSSTGTEFEYLWTTNDGNLVDGDTLLTPDVDQPGTYTLLITDNSNGCITIDSVVVNQDITIPDVVTGPSQTLDCALTSLDLDGSGSSTGPEFVYEWTSPDGNILAGENTLTPTIDDPGVYTLVVTNTVNGCQDSSATTIFESLDLPAIQATATGILTCEVEQLFLDGSGSASGDSITYLWVTNDGNILSGELGLNPEVDAPGTYTLTVFNEYNNCESILDVLVDQDIQLPDAEAGDPDILNCAVTTLQLNGTGSSSGTDFTYEWSSPDGGVIDSAQGTAQPYISLPGTYEVLVTNELNGCTSTDQVVIPQDIEVPDADAGLTDTITCFDPSLNLQGNASAGPQFVYTWTTPDGNIISGENSLNPLVDAPGSYELLVENTDNFCSSTATVAVGEDVELPVADAGLADLLTCAVTEINLDGSASTSGNFITYAWTTTDGSILSGTDAVDPVINAPGTYTLTVTNEKNGCTAEDQITVDQDISPPAADAGPTSELTCTINSVSLDGSASSAGAQFEYLWSSTDGNILSGETTLNPEVDEPGIYTLLVTDNQNGCTASSDVEITIDANVPLPDAGPDGLLTCAVTSLDLDGTGSVINSNLIFSWSTADGNIVTGGNTLTPEVDAPGTYILTLEDTTNNCIATSTAIIDQDIQNPSLGIEDPELLTCSVTSIDLDATASSAGLEFEYSWTTSDGQIAGGQNTLTPSVDAPGTYELLITNNQNGCTTVGSIDVDQDVLVPSVDAGIPETLTCVVTEVTVGGAGSSTGAEFQYEWTTTGGNITNGEDQPLAQVDAPGVYNLLITDIDNGCTATADIQIIQDIQAPQLAISEPDLLTCIELNSELTVTAITANASEEYLWTTTGGNILSGEDTETISLDAPGEYTCIVTDLVNGCTSEVSNTVLQDIEDPQADAGQPQVLTCASPSLELDGSQSSTGNFSYQWTTTDGNILSGENSLNPEVDALGTYQLVVTDNGNGCTALSTVDVDEDFDLPTVDAGLTDELTCAITSLSLDGNGSSQGSEFSYNWTTSDGNIVSGSETLEPVIDEPGTYTLEIIDNDNGCVDSDEVIITEDVDLPTALIDAQSGTSLTCTQTDLPLSGIPSTPAGILDFEWTTTDGSIFGDPQSANITITAGGSYVLEVTNQDNGCVNNATINIVVDTTAPALSILPPAFITCLEEEVEIDAGNSSSGPIFEYSWTAGSGGIIVSGADEPVLVVGSEAIYTLSILNTDNGCSSTESVVVQEDIDLPTAIAGAPQELDCVTELVPVTGAGSSAGPDFTYLWETTDGQIEGDPNQLQTDVSLPGIYSLIVTNVANGCSNTAQVEVQENTNVPTDILFDITPPLCFGDPGLVTLTSVSGGTGPYLFSFDGGETFVTGLGAMPLDPSSYDLVVQDAVGCEYSELVTIPSVPQLSIEAVEPEVKVGLGQSAQLRAQVNFPEDEIDSISWDPVRYLSCSDCLEPIVEGAEFNTYYTVTVTTVDGCVAEAEILLRVIEQRDVFIPNAFSPFDNDGKNDLLMIYANDRQVKQVSRFEVFNRWGERVFGDYNFRPNDPAHSWDGFFKSKEVNPGVFVYVAEIEFVDGVTLVYEGSVTVVK
jgi:hypothetical protein